MTIERIQSGPRMSQVVIHNKTVYLSGQVAEGARGASVTVQTGQILLAIDRLLAGVGIVGGAGLNAGARHGVEPAAGRRGIQD